MNITLDSEATGLVEHHFRSGGFNDPQEVLKAALILLTKKIEEEAQKWIRLREKLDEGLHAAATGDVVTGEEAKRLVRNALLRQGI